MFKLIGKLLVVLTVAGWADTASAYPITDTVTVEGKEWAQVDQFVGLSWSEINTVCPAGACGNGTLNGFDMAGWSWATVADLNNLFNHYIGFAALGPGPGEYTGPEHAFADSFYADGWRETAILISAATKTTEGWHADSADYWSLIYPFRDSVAACGLLGICGGNFDRAATDWNTSNVLAPGSMGAWFQRTSADVPGPATLPLLVLALATLGYSRRKRTTS